jgi:N-acetylmuramoyl-L-alanine amidase
MKIIEDILPINFQKGRQGPYPVDTIVIHVTEGDARSVRSWFHDPAANVSAHYMVQKNGDVIHFVHEYDTAWANGRVVAPTASIVLQRKGANPNWWTISIEHEGSGHEELTDLQRQSSLALMRTIKSRHPLVQFNRQHILGHHEIFAPKTCPGAISVDRLVRELNAQADFSDVSGGHSSTAPS